MAKQGMKRPETEQRKKSTSSVPEIQGKAKHGKTKAASIIAGTQGVGQNSPPDFFGKEAFSPASKFDPKVYSTSSVPSQKAYHTVPFEEEKPLSDVYKEIDNDLARDNLENDLTAADLQDM